MGNQWKSEHFWVPGRIVQHDFMMQKLWLIMTPQSEAHPAGERRKNIRLCSLSIWCCLHMFAYVCMFAEKVWGVTNRKLNRKINSVQLCLNNDRSGRYFFNLLHAPARPAMTLSWHLLTLLHLVASCCQLLIPGVAGMTSAMALRQHLFRNISSSIRRTWAA